MNPSSKTLAEIIAAVERIHAPDLIAYEHHSASNATSTTPATPQQNSPTGRN